jgi:ABC-2 type transport system permease protein
MIDVTLIISAGVWHFNVPIRGSVILIFFSASLFLFTTLGLGLFFSTISKTQQQAMFVSFMFINPAILLSGFMFPIENMPDPIQYLTYLNPLRYFLKVIRGIFLKGNGLMELWPQLAALAVFGVIIFTMASAKFSKRLT